MSSGLELQKLLQITITYLNENKINIDVMNSQKPSMNANNVWHKLALKYFGNLIVRKDSQNIYSWWVRNTKGYRQSVLQVTLYSLNI
jgi:hypothetical protein